MLPSGYRIKHEIVAIPGVPDLAIRSLLDRQEFSDPDGAADREGISSALWSLFGVVWPSGLQLAAWVARRPVRADERILEIGCGLAVASLVAHRRGALVTASDCHPLAREFLEENVRLNSLAPLPYCHANWDTGPEAEPGSAHGDQLSGRFDLIIGSDVLYERDAAGALPHFIDRYLTPAGEVLIVDPNRGNRAAFHRRMAALGYALTETRIEDPKAPGGPFRGRLLHYRRG